MKDNLTYPQYSKRKKFGFHLKIQMFIKVNSEADHLNIFLAELKDENVCTTMYAPQYKHQQKQVKNKIGCMKKKILKKEIAASCVIQ